MNITLQSGDFSAVISSKGGELISMKDGSGNEYIWTAEDVWKRHAPLLFPFVCNTLSKKYTVNGKEYTLSNHGFARDMDFFVNETASDHVIMTINSDDSTREKYPFDFRFTVAYKLTANKLGVSMTAENTGKEKMPFFVGGHPGFLCPFTADKDSSFQDYDIVYEKPETIIQQLNDGNVTIVEQGTTVPVTRQLFKNDVFMKDKPASSSVSLVSRKSGKAITVSFDNSGCIAVWSPYEKSANFVCLEPWAAPPVYCCDTEELTKMPHAKIIGAGESYCFAFDIEIKQAQ